MVCSEISNDLTKTVDESSSRQKSYDHMAKSQLSLLTKTVILNGQFVNFAMIFI
jgi:hypothetical protein